MYILLWLSQQAGLENHQRTQKRKIRVAESMGYFINRKASKKTVKHTLKETLLLCSYWSLLSSENVSNLSHSGLTGNQELKDKSKCVQMSRRSESVQWCSRFRHR